MPPPPPPPPSFPPLPPQMSGKALRKIRFALGVDQLAFARLLGWTGGRAERTIQRLESGALIVLEPIAVKARALLAEHKSKQACCADNVPPASPALENPASTDRPMRTDAHETRKNQGS